MFHALFYSGAMFQREAEFWERYRGIMGHLEPPNDEQLVVVTTL